jgi:hypothetical protein
MDINAAIIYRGPSPVNGTQIVVIISNMATKSDNDKTGDMAQVDILVDGIHPYEAINSGADAAVCGDCSLRQTVDANGKKDRVCYVNLIFGPGAKHKKNQRGTYPIITPEICAKHGKGIRLGSYGDPAMVKYSIWADLLGAGAFGHTAYTHQWAEQWFDPRMLEYCMASLDGILTVEKLDALHPRARYYRLAKSYDDLQPNEIACPSKAGKRKPNGHRVVECKDCKLCSGGTRQGAKSIVIVEGA